MSTCPPNPSSSFIQIDPGVALTFLINNLFVFKMQSPIRGAVENRAYSGDLHLLLRYFKDKFTISFPKLTEDQHETLNQLAQQTGTNAFHTIIYSSIGIVRKYDNATLPGYGINTDVNRIRKQVYIRELVFPHWDNIANTYSGILTCEEQ